jgi:HSP20 family molecular chaperone IbpA
LVSDDNYIFYFSDTTFSHIAPSSQSRASEARINKNFDSLAPILTADLIQSETDFRVHADLPGVDPSDLELTVEGKTLLRAPDRHDEDHRTCQTVSH